MREREFYIGGQWVSPKSTATVEVINPATEEMIATLACGNSADINEAVGAARSALPGYSSTSRELRIHLLKRIRELYRARLDELGATMSLEMGAPLKFATEAQATSGIDHLDVMIATLDRFQFQHALGTTLLHKEPIGVCGLITPWNWPLNQIICKVAPALAAGCTIVLKPSEVAPLCSLMLAEILHEAGVPAGVFNLVNGDSIAGSALASHCDVNLVSFTGSTRAGILVAQAAAPSVKRVHQELGGKSANILLPDADLETSVSRGVRACFSNSGQGCTAGSRMLVHTDHYEAAIMVAKATAEAIRVGPPDDDKTVLGPVVSRTQFDRVQSLIKSGMDEGARLVTGGLGRPQGLTRGYYVRPTVFADVRNDMRIARTEIFGPVICLLPYETVDQAIEIANDSEYGLAGYVQSRDLERARAVALKLHTGSVAINYAPWDLTAPFGGFKQSGNGKENGAFGLEEFLETKAVLGFSAGA